MKTGIELITQERSEHFSKHGRTIELDVENNNEYQLPDAAIGLLQPVPEGMEEAYQKTAGDYPPVGWDQDKWKQMLAKPYKDRLIIGGALIAAEIDRINAVAIAESKLILEAHLGGEDEG